MGYREGCGDERLDALDMLHVHRDSESLPAMELCDLARDRRDCGLIYPY